MYRVTRTFKFDSAHRLFGYSGKCKHVHGHSYKAEITVEGEQLDHLDMLLDFNVLKDISRWIDVNWDHNLLIQSEDTLWEDALRINNGKFPYNMLDYQPTAEAMCRVLFVVASGVVSSTSKPCRVSKVRIYETEDCCAEYEE